MSTTILPTHVPRSTKSHPAVFQKVARKAVFALLRSLSHGRITLREQDSTHVFGPKTEEPALEATLTVHDPRFYAKVLLGGSVGAGEAYMSGYWSADNLATVVQIAAMNQSVRDGVDEGWMRIYAPLHQWYHFMRRNTFRGSRNNIIAHYDLGNDFYRLFLDDTMTYSCAVFEGEDRSLKSAQIAKYDRICKKLQLTADDNLLEIGTGWGGFAIHAATTTGCRVTTTTISDQQFELATQRVAEAGLSHRITILQTDYRELEGQYDKLVSIEMIEAVGHQYLDTFFKVCSKLLKPDGMMLLQAITIADHAFDAYKHSVDFIRRYIFPGSCLPSVTAMSRSIAGQTDLRIFHLEDITPHYARTLRLWREQFFAQIEKVKKLGYDDVFVRMWDFYLSYCEGGFRSRHIGDIQILLTKPMCRRDPLLADPDAR
jgi:cyclopropane-fatty-acyl-phospholipid synthase